MLENLKKFFTIDDSIHPDHFESFEGSYEESLHGSNEASRLNQWSNSKITPLPTTKKQKEIVIERPSSYSDTESIAESIKQNKIVFVNLKDVDRETSIRIVDFLSGVTYRDDGVAEKVADKMVLFVPKDCEVTNSAFVSSYSGE